MSRIERIDDYRVRLPREGGMRVDGIVYADERVMRDIRQDESLQQVRNVAHAAVRSRSCSTARI